MPTTLTWNEARHLAVAPGFRLAAMATWLPTCCRLAPVPWLAYWSSWSRVEKRAGEASSWTSSPAAAWLVSLLTVPVTVTVAPGRAVCGLIESMTIDTRPACAGSAGPACAVPACGLAACTALACAGAASASTAVTAAGMATAAARDRTRRETSAVSKPCTLGMLLPIETGPVLCRYPQCPCP